MTTVKTENLTGAALDWAVAHCEGIDLFETEGWIYSDGTRAVFRPSTDWRQGGFIIEREEIELRIIPAGRDPDNWVGASATDAWEANISPPDVDYIRAFGPTPLIAAMRCYVASKLGDEIGVPEVLK